MDLEKKGTPDTWALMLQGRREGEEKRGGVKLSKRGHGLLVDVLRDLRKGSFKSYSKSNKHLIQVLLALCFSIT